MSQLELGGPDAPGPVAGLELPGRLSHRVIDFVRVLREAGFPAGTAQTIDALQALSAVDVTSREEFYWALHCVLVRRPEQSPVFDRAFAVFWDRAPARPEPPEQPPASLPQEGPAGGEGADVRDVEEAEAVRAEDEEADADGTPAFSARESLSRKDFREMSAEELQEARRIVSRIKLSLEPVPTRRYRPDPTGARYDLRATMRTMMRSSPDLVRLERRARTLKPPPLVVLCDISGSMRAYTHMLLRFLHALTNQRRAIHTFLFGTRLTNATRYLRRRDPGEALEQLADQVLDFDGGTRIGHAIGEFNRRWSRKVLTQRSIVILITDGLDQEGGEGLAEAMQRLRRSSKRVVWLNPLLRWEGFEPQAAGIRAMVRHVDDLRTIHNLESLEELARTLEDLDRRGSVPASWRGEPSRPGRGGMSRIGPATRSEP